MTDPLMIEIKESNNAEISISKLVVPLDNRDYGSSSNLRETPSSINFFSKQLNFSDFVLKNPTPLTSEPQISKSRRNWDLDHQPFSSIMAKLKTEPRHFFKVFFPEQSSTILIVQRIPPAFRENIEAESDKRVSLKGPSGSKWEVNLVKDSNEFFFDDGWGEFVADHSLVMGDFLLFCYRGNSKFKVLVFDSTACEKKKAFLARPSGEQSEESREEVSVVEEDEDEENKPLVLFAKKIFEKNLKRKRGINEISGISDIFKKKKKQFQSEVDGSDSKRSKSSSTSQQDYLGSNSRDLIIPKQEIEESEPYLAAIYCPYFSYTSMEQNEMSMQRNCAFTFRCTHVNKMTRLHQRGQDSSSSPHSIEKKSSSKKSEKSLELVLTDENASPSRSIFRVGSLISQRRPVTEEEVKMTPERAATFKSNRPFAIAVMQDSYVYTSFFMVLVVSLLSVLPAVSRTLSNKTYRLSLLGTTLSSFYSLYALYGLL